MRYRYLRMVLQLLSDSRILEARLYAIFIKNRGIMQMILSCPRGI